MSPQEGDEDCSSTVLEESGITKYTYYPPPPGPATKLTGKITLVGFETVPPVVD